MSPEADILTAVIQLVNGSIGLGIAIWIIREGMTRMDKMQTQHEVFTNTVLTQQQNNNDQLMSLVSTLCAQPTQPINQNPIKNSPKP